MPAASYICRIMAAQQLTKTQLYILAVSAGVCVANIYYSQPILSAIAQDIGISETTAGKMPFYSQVGYGLGLLLLTPLGDKVDRKKLIIFFQLLLLLTLGGIALIHNVTLLLLLNFFIGFFAVATQIIMPFAAALAGPGKGKTVGIVFTGVLVGILGARILSGFIASQWSWRYVYALSAVLLTVTTVLIGKFMPSLNGTYNGSYISLIGSSVKQLKRFSLLRKSAGIGILLFGAFSSFWTTLTFHLSGEHFHYNSNQIGLFGILGIGGALTAPLFGRLADKGSPAKIQSWAIVMVILSVAMIWLVPSSLVIFIIAVFLLDVGVQASQVINLSQIYTLDETAHSRINTIYMTLMFIGGAIGTLAGVYAWGINGWETVCIQLMIWTVAAFLISIVFRKTGAPKH
jgi:predicted MFS family arabinose efflux permease